MWLLALLGCAPPEFSGDALVAARAAADEVDGARLMDHVEALVALRGAEESEYTHVAAAQYVFDQLEGLGLDPVIEDCGPDEQPCFNVIGDIPGGSRGDEIVLVSAHHDAFFSGADDNATGVAVVLEVARVLADAAPDRTVRIVSFDLEEQGLVGSYAYARAHEDDLPYRSVNLDMVGYADDAPGSQETLLGLSLPDAADFLAVIAPEYARKDLLEVTALSRELDPPLETVGVLPNGSAHSALLNDLLRSDHAPFWDERVPGLFLTDTADFRNPAYHSAQDTPDTLDPAFFTDSGRFTAAVVAAWAVEE